MQNNVLEYLENGALAECPKKIAVVDSHGSYTFEDVERYAKNCAALIVERSRAINSPIAVFLPKTVSTLAADLGIVYSGNCYANLDVASPPERLKSILRNLRPDIIITDAAHGAALRRLDVPHEQLLLIEAAMTEVAAYDERALLARLERLIDTDPLCIIHTSGSTGVPKGVVLTHRGTIAFMDWVFGRFALGRDDVIGSLSPFYFDIYTLELFLCLAKGATLAIVPDQTAAFPPKLLDFMVERNVTFIFWVPTIMVNIANQDLLAKWQLPDLRTVFFAGEVFPTRPLNYWRSHLPGAMFVNLYGPIEITVDCTYFVVDRELADDEKLPIGFPCRNGDVLILNEHDEAAKDDEPGELCVRGSSLALGYWNDPERTAQAFVRNPLQPNYPELIYRTGDLVYRNSRGEIMFIGRKDFQIKHSGYRIELGEIEHALLRVEGVRNCCVTYDQRRKEITAFFESDEDLTPGFMRQRLTAFLPKYMLPTVFRRIDALPRNPNGKIDRRRLACGDA